VRLDPLVKHRLIGTEWLSAGIVRRPFHGSIATPVRLVQSGARCCSNEIEADLIVEIVIGDNKKSRTQGPGSKDIRGRRELAYLDRETRRTSLLSQDSDPPARRRLISGVTAGNVAALELRLLLSVRRGNQCRWVNRNGSGRITEPNEF